MCMCNFGNREVKKLVLCFGKINLVSKYELIGLKRKILKEDPLMKGREATIKRMFSFTNI